ncbi:MAG: heparan-alpha-glucosaminide N-acetyltransferase domain-containing protein [Oscillospiraceae bacterium]|jgi:uncharacterized membrane protein|nr:heparan-alpha-glucosaminide N-acetyltransferase domain-containing protein [Oscillospiraceae bacterium]
MFTAIKNCFGSEPINDRRQSELDMAKGLAIVFMVWTHVFEELSPNVDGVMGMLVKNILGGPFAAPIFMICMGIGITYSKKNAPQELLRRGIGLLGTGFLLNIFRFVVPDLIQYALTNNKEYLCATFSLFSVDILQFAGLAFIFIGLAKKLRLKNMNFLLVGIVASALGTALRGVSTGNYIADQFIGYLWGTDTRTYFPFLNWLIFPIVGMVFGTLFKRCTNKKNFYLRLSPLCIVIMLVYLGFTIHYGNMFLSDGSYYFIGLIDATFFVILAMAIFGTCYAVLKLFPKLSFKPIMRWSRHINAIYCIHWTLGMSATCVKLIKYKGVYA